MEKDILHADNILEENRTKGIFYLLAASIILLFFVSIVLIFFPVKTPVADNYATDLESFLNKTQSINENVALSQSEINAFLNEAVESKEYAGGVLQFPETLYVILHDNSAEVFLRGTFLKLKFTVSSWFTLEKRGDRLVEILPHGFSLGKMVLPSAFFGNILEFFNTSLVYSIPAKIKKIDVVAGNCILIVNEKKSLKSAKDTSAKDTLSSEGEKKPKKKKAKIKSIDKTKTQSKPKAIKSNKVSDQRADGLHKTADYFHKTRKNAFAMKYYQQIIDEYPEYSRIDEVKKKIAILKSYSK